MPAIFLDNPGRAAAHVVAGLPAVVKVQGMESSKALKAAITGYRLGSQGGYQFLHTLRDVIYVYSFGERIGQMSLQGVAFMGVCGGDSKTGLDNLFDYYNENRLNRRGTHIAINLGHLTALQGFLIGFDFVNQDPVMGLGQFTFQLAYPPK